MKILHKGFTLIELLVVIAIIGLLASIVLVGVNSARNKGKDSRVISDVRSIAASLATGYNGTGYPDLKSNATAGGSVTGNANCKTNSWNSSGPQASKIEALAIDICQQETNGYSFSIVSSNAAGDAVGAWAIYGPLTAPASGGFYCMDSVGKINTAAAVNSQSTCP